MQSEFQPEVVQGEEYKLVNNRSEQEAWNDCSPTIVHQEYELLNNRSEQEALHWKSEL